MSNCKHLKLKLNRQLECKLKGKIITWNECKNCVFRRLNLTNISELSTKKEQIKKRTSKLSKLERNRKSIITNDLSKCIICGAKKDNLHEVIYGKNRLNSIKYNLVIPLCLDHHIKIHNDIQLDLKYKRIAQECFNKYYPELSFIEIFGRNYL